MSPSDHDQDSFSRTATPKAVTITEPGTRNPGVIPTALDEVGEPSASASPHNPIRHRVKTNSRTTGRSPMQRSTSSLHSMPSQSSLVSNLNLVDDGEVRTGDAEAKGVDQSQTDDPLVARVAEWVKVERRKRASRKSKAHRRPEPASAGTQLLGGKVHGSPAGSSSEDSDGSQALDKLERILAEHMTLGSNKNPDAAKERPGSYFPRRRTSSLRKLRKGSSGGSSDSEYHDGDAVVPTAEVILDNSRTLAYTGGAAESDADLGRPIRPSKDKEAWIKFKNEIIRLAHTLRLKGWRRVPLDHGADIEVERLSGALTNAVYVVSPPKYLPETPSADYSSTKVPISSTYPKKLLLRIYGPQVEHLIDRNNELQILKRLARKRIGPRLLGTFLNGRFEEFFHARTLTPRDLRIPETSKQIAKRMRELHDGIELLEEERDAGPFVWRNWDKWVARCEEVIQWVDGEVTADQRGARGSGGGEAWKKRGLVCGVEWSVFRRTVERYRRWLDAQYGGPSGIRQHLVFAHNDTQYGNLLRLEPSGESPLLLPANEHKQLVVIDFEYASANVPGLEFANHFTEWCYNYHDPERPYALNQGDYPTVEEQRRFVKAYVQHRPQFNARGLMTPKTTASPGPSSSISAFMLDSRAPPTQIAEEEQRISETTTKEVDRLMHEARIWRVANSAQWVAWGVVQAKVPGMDQALAQQKKGHEAGQTDPSPSPALATDPLSPEAAIAAQDLRDKRPEGLVAEALAAGVEVPPEEDEEEFDYLGYAQERAMFFWGDLVALGLVRKDELPAHLLPNLKIVDY